MKNMEYLLENNDSDHIKKLSYLISFILMINILSCKSNNQNIDYCSCQALPESKDLLIEKIKAGTFSISRNITFGYESRFGEHIKIALGSPTEWIFIKNYEYGSKLDIDFRYSDPQLLMETRNGFSSIDSLQKILDQYYENCIWNTFYWDKVRFLGVLDGSDTTCILPPTNYLTIGIVEDTSSAFYKEIISDNDVEIVNDSIFTYYRNLIYNK